MSGDAAGRAARREFIRTHHPDRGGDPQVFDAGLRRLSGPDGAAQIVFFRRRRGWRRLAAPVARAARLVRRGTTPPRVH